VYYLALIIFLPRKYRHYLLGLISMTKHDFVELARFSFLAADFLKLKYPPIILFVAIDELHTGIEYYVFKETKMLGIVLHEFLKVGGA
jgi:hypothetical protein